MPGPSLDWLPRVTFVAARTEHSIATSVCAVPQYAFILDSSQGLQRDERRGRLVHPCTLTVYITPGVVPVKTLIVELPPGCSVCEPSRPGRDQRTLMTSQPAPFTLATSALVVEM